MPSDWTPPEPADELWALRECAKPGGFVPHARGTISLLGCLENSRLVRQGGTAPVWYITQEGRDELARRTAAR